MTAPEPAGVGAADRKAVEELLQTLLKALRAIQLYLPNNPMYEQACQKVGDAFAAVWQETDEVLLEVTDGEFHWEDAVVYRDPNKSDNLALMLHKDGLRSLTLMPGVEEGEAIRLLELLNRVRTLPPEAEDDLQTLLWEGEFEFVRYTAVELGEEEGAPIEGSGSGSGAAAPPPEAIKEEVQRQLASAAEEQAANEFVSIEEFDASLYQLEADEVAYLKRELAREYDQDLRTNVLAILCDIFEFQTNPDVRTEILSILGSFVPHLLAAGDSDSVVYVLRETQAIRRRAEELTDEQSKALDELPARLSEPVAFGHLLKALEQGGPNITDQELERLFGGLQPTVFETALGWLPQLATERIRSLLEDALIKIAIANSSVLRTALESRDREVAHGAVGFAKTLASPDVVPALGRLLQGPDRELRNEAVSVLEAIGSPEAMRELEKAIDDANRAIRLAAIRILVEHGYKRVLSKIEIKVTDREFRNTDLTEKKAFLEAYGTLAGEAGVDMLATMLLPRGFMKKKEDPQVRACAAMGLGRIGTPAAKAVLQQAASDKDALVRNAVNQALRDSR